MNGIRRMNKHNRHYILFCFVLFFTSDLKVETDLQTFPLPTDSISRRKENVALDSSHSMFSEGCLHRIVMAREVSSDAGLHTSDTRSRYRMGLCSQVHTNAPEYSQTPPNTSNTTKCPRVFLNATERYQMLQDAQQRPRRHARIHLVRGKRCVPSTRWATR